MPPPHKLCMIPGPVEFHQDVLAAMSTPAISHIDPEFIPIFGETIEMMRQVVFSRFAQPFIVAGSCTLGWDMMVNLIEPGDPVLVLNTGYFGDHFAECLRVYGAVITTIRSKMGTTPPMDVIKKTLQLKKFKMVSITHVDTSTGVLMDIQSVANIVKSISPFTLVVVDGVCSVGSEQVRFDDWQLDVVISGSQKGLGVPPGLSIVVASDHAVNVSKTRKTPVASYYCSWEKWIPIMQAYESRKPAYFATPPVQLIYALHTSLKAITSQPMEARFERHKEVAAKFRETVREIGLEIVAVDDECAANGMTAIWLPEGVELSQLIPALASHGVQIAGGLLEGYANKYFRIGHMGISVMELERRHIDKTIKALITSLQELDYQG